MSREYVIIEMGTIICDIYVSNRDFRLRSFQLLSGKSFQIQERLKDEELSSRDCVFKCS